MVPPATSPRARASRLPAASRRRWLFAGLAGLALLMLPMAGEVRWGEAVTAVSVALAAVAVVLAVRPLRDGRHPDVVAALALLALAVLRDSAGGATSGYGILALMPVLWVAFTGGRAHLQRTLVAVALMIGLPLVLIGDPRYPATAWRSGVLLVISCAVIGVVVQELLRRERTGAAARRRLLHAVNDGLIITDITGRVVEVNEALCAMTGYAAGEIVGRSAPLPAWPVEDHAALLRAHAAAIAAGGGEIEARLVRKDGAELFVIISLAVDPDAGAGAPAVIATVKDVTERARLHEDVGAERDRTRAILEGMRDGVAMTHDATIVDVNPALSRITGFTREQLVGATAPYPFVAPESVDQVRSARDRFDDAHGASFETTFMRADGSRFTAEVRSTRLGGRPGEPAAVILNIRDVTERKEAEQATLQRAKELAALSRVTRAVAHAGPAQAGRVVCEMAMRVADATAATIWQPDRKGELRATCALGGAQPDFTISPDAANSALRAAYRTGEAVFAADAARLGAVDGRLRDLHGAASVHFQPIASDHQVLGVLALSWDRPRATLSPQDKIVEVLAHEAAVAITKAAMHDELARTFR